MVYGAGILSFVRDFYFRDKIELICRAGCRADAGKLRMCAIQRVTKGAEFTSESVHFRSIVVGERRTVIGGQLAVFSCQSTSD
jgi:hypothetical protein